MVDKIDEPLASVYEVDPVRRVLDDMHARDMQRIDRLYPAHLHRAPPENPAGAGDTPPLDRWRADAVLEGDRRLWGLERIAQFLDRHPDTVRKWIGDPDVAIPISKPAGVHFAFASDLVAWLKTS